jgi:hypothetical protein
MFFAIKVSKSFVTSEVVTSLHLRVSQDRLLDKTSSRIIAGSGPGSVQVNVRIFLNEKLSGVSMLGSQLPPLLPFLVLFLLDIESFLPRIFKSNIIKKLCLVIHSIISRAVLVYLGEIETSLFPSNFICLRFCNVAGIDRAW